MSPWQIGIRLMMPHLLPQVLVGMVLMFPHAILHEASITFLGFGLSPEQPAIGVILSESMKYLTMGKWWLALFPGLLLVLVVIMFHVIGDTLNSLLDPSRVMNREIQRRQKGGIGADGRFTKRRTSSY